jgi:hypothetical protein
MITAPGCAIALVLFGVALDGNDNYGLLSAKLTLLGLVGAIGTFQYQTWRQVWREYLDVAGAREWQELERRLDALPAEAQEQYGPMLRQTLAQRDRFLVQFLQGTLPHNEAILWNAVSAATLLMGSCLSDLGRLLLPGFAGGAIRVLSTATFLASFGPFLDSAWRYMLSLTGEFNAAEWQGNAQRGQLAPPQAADPTIEPLANRDAE